MLNTPEMLDRGTHVQTSPFARAAYQTTATSVVVAHWNNVHSVQPVAAEIGVFVNGVYQESIRPTADGSFENEVALPAGDKLVEIVTNGFRSPADNNVISTLGTSIWLRSLTFNAPANRVISNKRGLVIVADSIANGSTLLSAVQEAYPRLMQAQRLFPISIVGRGGMALFDVTARLSNEQLFRPGKLAREVLRHNPLSVLYTLGFNDDFKSVWPTPSNTSAYIAAGRRFVQAMYNADPSISVVTMPLLFATNTGPNYASYRNASDQFGYEVTAGSGTWYRHTTPAPTLVASDLHADGIHPNASGHSKIAAALLGRFPENQMPPGFTFTGATASGSTAQASRAAMLQPSGPSFTLVWRSSPFSTLTMATAAGSVSNGAPELRRYLEFSVNNGPWTWLQAADGNNNVTLTLAQPSELTDITTIRFRRRGGDGTVLHTVTIDYT